MTETWKADDKYFLHHHTFEYSSTVMQAVSCTDCILETKKKLMLHYVVIIDGVSYYIPEYVTVIVDPTMNEGVSNENGNFGEDYMDEVYTDAYQDENGKTDFVEAAKKELGVDISAKDRADQADHNGEHLLDEINKRYPNEK